MRKKINLGRIIPTINDEYDLTINSADNSIKVNAGLTTTIDVGHGITDHIYNTNNPHNLTKDDVGLDKIDWKSSQSVRNHLSEDHINHAYGFNLLEQLNLIDNGYGFEIDLEEADPYNSISYIGTNKAYYPAYMDFKADKFNYGDWKDVWFIKNIKVAILGYDGKIVCELDKDDYTKDINGNDVDISVSCNGNVMVGIPTVWIKHVAVSDTVSRYYFSDRQIDSDFHAYCHTNQDGEVVPYKWLSAYHCYLHDGRFRSVNDVSGYRGGELTTEFNYAKANNVNDMNIWFLDEFSNVQLIGLLLLLIGKSTDTQEIFGHGNERGYYVNKNNTGEWKSDSNGRLYSGTMNKKGLFYGTTTTDIGDYRGVKVFGIENYWGNSCRRLLGLFKPYNSSNIYIKLTPSTEDGSSVVGYYPKTSRETQEQILEYIEFENFLEPDGNKTTISGTSHKRKGTKYGLLPYAVHNETKKYFPEYFLYHINYNLDAISCGYTGRFDASQTDCGPFSLMISYPGYGQSGVNSRIGCYGNI